MDPVGGVIYAPLADAILRIDLVRQRSYRSFRCGKVGEGLFEYVVISPRSWVGGPKSPSGC